MCFSAAASFTAGASLSVIGGASISQAHTRSSIPFASIPLLFGMQQVAEGVVWLSLASPWRLAIAQYVFLFFSHVLWPTIVPLSVYLVEPGHVRRRALLTCVLMGVVVSAYFLYFLLTETVYVKLLAGSIAYVGEHFSVTFILSPYTVATCASCLLSSHRIINLFGAVTFLSALAAFQLYEHTFVSVWCFFAAILSAIVLWHMWKMKAVSRCASFCMV